MSSTNTVNRSAYPISVPYDTTANKFEPYEKLLQRVSDLAPVYNMTRGQAQ